MAGRFGDRRGAPPATPTAERALNARAGHVIAGGPVEFDRVVPPAGNPWAMGRQCWLVPERAGQTVRFWAGVDLIHLTIAGARVKSLRSHLSTADVAQQGAVAAGPPPLPLAEDGAVIEVDRAVNKGGIVSLAGRQVLAAEILGGRPVIVRIEPQTPMFLDPVTRELLRVRTNQLTPEQALRLQGARPAGPPPRPKTEAVTVQRRVSTTGVITVCGQHVALGHVHAGHSVRVHVSEHTLDARTRRRNPHRPSHHQPARRGRQGQPASPPGNVQPNSRAGGGERSIKIERNQEQWTKPLRNLGRALMHLPRLVRQASPEIRHC